MKSIYYVHASELFICNCQWFSAKINKTGRKQTQTAAGMHYMKCSLCKFCVRIAVNFDWNFFFQNKISKVYREFSLTHIWDYFLDSATKNDILSMSFFFCVAIIIHLEFRQILKVHIHKRSKMLFALSHSHSVNERCIAAFM